MIKLESNFSELKVEHPSNRLLPGGYVCAITNVEAKEGKNGNQYLFIEYDIVEGECAGYADRFKKEKGWNPLKFNQNYTGKGAYFFKRMLTAMEASNKNFTVDGFMKDGNEQRLCEKLVGFVLGDEEYRRQDGGIGYKKYVADYVSIDDIRNKNYKPAKAKKLADEGTSRYPTATTFAEMDATGEDNLPF